MRRLYHQSFHPLSRQVVLILNEKSLDFTNHEMHPLDKVEGLAAINPAETLPVLHDEPPTGGEIAACPVNTILEYLEEAYPQPALMPSTSAGRAEVRRLYAWFNDKFMHEVSAYITYEHIEKRLRRQGQPDPDKLRIGRDALNWHMDYINWLCENRHWLAGEKFTLADIACASHLSCLDYCDAVPWQDFTFAKGWYARIKSRPSFRPLLGERVQGLPAARHYDNPDF